VLSRHTAIAYFLLIRSHADDVFKICGMHSLAITRPEFSPEIEIAVLLSFSAKCADGRHKSIAGCSSNSRQISVAKDAMATEEN
jgi:hypothetical protein